MVFLCKLIYCATLLCNLKAILFVAPNKLYNILIKKDKYNMINKMQLNQHMTTDKRLLFIFVPL